MLPVRLLSPGEKARIVRIRGNDKVKNRLAGLGFVENSVISLIGDAGGGNLILALGDARIALDSDLACRMLVEPIAQAESAAEKVAMPEVKSDFVNKSVLNKSEQPS